MRSLRLLFASALLAAGPALVACPPPSPEVSPVAIPTAPSSRPDVPIATATPAAEPPDPPPHRCTQSRSPRVAPISHDDPAQGAFSLREATAGLGGKGTLVAVIKTSEGELRCDLEWECAPNTVANFVGLARGLRPWKSPLTGQWTRTPAYDGTRFHRVVKGFMIQGGDPKGSGSGEPGYVIADELWDGAKHDRAGLLCMANRGPDTNGMQFFVTDASAPHLDSGYTIFGDCDPVSVVHAIASAPVQGERPLKPIVIESVTIEGPEIR